MLEKLAYRVLRRLKPETAHKLAAWGMKMGWFAPPLSCRYTNLFNYWVQSPLGLAAGFDKNGHLVQAAQQYGFGWTEVGSVTFRGGPGNPKPRLFRVDKTHLLNRMGLNGDPAEVVAERLRQYDNRLFAVNIAKTHDPAIVGDKAIEDVLSSYRLLGSLGIYTALNISCPNTAEGKTFEEPGSLKELLHEIHAIGGSTLLLKVSSHLETKALHEIMRVSHDKVAGFIACNTRKFQHSEYGAGGLSGPANFYSMCNTIDVLKTTQLPVIACGGINSPTSFMLAKSRGAIACQAYTGFVIGPHAGPRFVVDIIRSSDELSKSD